MKKYYVIKKVNILYPDMDKQYLYSFWSCDPPPINYIGWEIDSVNAVRYHSKKEAKSIIKTLGAGTYQIDKIYQVK